MYSCTDKGSRVESDVRSDGDAQYRPVARRRPYSEVHEYISELNPKQR